MLRAVNRVFGGCVEKGKKEEAEVESTKGEERSGIVRTEVDVPINRSIVSKAHKKLAFIVDNVR